MAEVDYEDIELHERLRAARAVIAQQKAEIERLRAAGDKLTEAHIDDLCDCNQPECVTIREAHAAWQEARRG